MQPFCEVIGFCQLFLLISNKRQMFIRTWVISRHSFEMKNISDFFFLPFFLKSFFFPVQNITSVNFQKVCCRTRSSSQPTVRKTWSLLVVVVMSALLQRCKKKKKLYTLKVTVIVIHLYNLNS